MLHGKLMKICLKCQTQINMDTDLGKNIEVDMMYAYSNLPIYL